jgi:hypothetical protein
MKISKKLIVPAIIIMLLGVLIAVGPWTFAPVCEVHTAENPNGLWVVTNMNKTLPMPCGYTARAEVGVGAIIVVLGGFVLFASSIGIIAALGAAGILLGGLTIALPTILTKTCALASHPCNTVTAPILEFLGIGLIGLSLGIIVFRKKLML